MLNYNIHYDYNSYWINKDFKGCIRVNVNITDFRNQDSEKWITNDSVLRDTIVVWIKPREMLQIVNVN